MEPQIKKNVEVGKPMVLNDNIIGFIQDIIEVLFEEDDIDDNSYFIKVVDIPNWCFYIHVSDVYKGLNKVNDNYHNYIVTEDVDVVRIDIKGESYVNPILSEVGDNCIYEDGNVFDGSSICYVELKENVIDNVPVVTVI